MFEIFTFIKENSETLFTISRYFTEIVVLYILFKYRYKDRDVELVLNEELKQKLIEDFTPEELIDDKKYRDDTRRKNDAFIDQIKISDTNYDKINEESEFIFGSLDFECADYNFYDFVTDPRVIETIREYGVGTCGPPGFYGTLDIHLELESKIAKILGNEAAILYSNSFTCVNSVITCFCRQFDIVFYDINCNEAIIRALGITKGSSISYINMEDLESKMKFVEKKKRNFIVTEGIFRNTGKILNLPEIVRIKKKYKLRLILDESLSIPLLHQKGISGYYNMYNEIDIIIGSLSHAYVGNGGFACGKNDIVDYQRLSAQSYCFSAAMPGFAAMNAICNLEKDISSVHLNRLTRYFKKIFTSDSYVISSEDDVPMIIITKKENLKNWQSYDTDELVYLRKTKKILEKDKIRIGIVENPYPSVRLNLKTKFKEKDVKYIVEKLMKYL